MKKDNITWLQKFYLRLCDGEWEHQFGCDISNLDNPGWNFEFDLSELPFEDLKFTTRNIQRSEHDWVIYEVKDKKFIGSGGPLNLDEMIGFFRNWIETTDVDMRYIDEDEDMEQELLDFKKKNL